MAEAPDIRDKPLDELEKETLQGNDSCELGTQMEVCLVAPTAVLADISAILQCVWNPSSSLQANVIQKGVGTYSITFTPQVRGRHDLIVKVKDEEITGSPFRVFVKIPPTQLGQPVHKIDDLDHPWGIAINDKQQLVVAEVTGSKASIIERDGKKVETIGSAKLHNPCGVATSPDGTIYVTDLMAQYLLKFDPEGRHLKTVRNELESPYSVKIIHNQLYVVVREKSLVKIFDMDCNFVGTIQTKECPEPYDVAQGPDGLYVVGEKKISVYTCAPNGNFIRHLNIQPSSLKLSQFWGICFDSSGHIIATDYDNGVYVFKPSGEYVTSFGLVSSGEIECPSGVAVDEDGFVYVCGYSSNNVVVF